MPRTSSITITTNPVAWLFSRHGALAIRSRYSGRRLSKEISRLLVTLQYRFHAATQLAVSRASTVQIVGTLRRRQAECLRENNYIPVRSIIHFTIRSLPSFYGKGKSQELNTSN